MSAEQYRHDYVNLQRLLRRLEKAVSPPQWAAYERQAEQNPGQCGLKVLGEVQKAKYARKLLSSVRDGGSGRVDELQERLQNVLQFLESQSERFVYKPPRPEPILPTIPAPEPPLVSVPESILKPDVDATREEQEIEASDHAADLLMSPSDDVPLLSLPLPLPEDTLIPSLPTKSTDTQNTLATNALHEELQNQLSQMSTQLRMNALHFQSSLAADKLALDAAGEKLESNYDAMQKQRSRLTERDKSARGWKMTGIWFGSVLVVLVAFFMMVWIIRFT